MAFQIKDFASIAASMVNYAKAIQKRITDFSPGSVARTMLEAPAIEIEEFYQQTFIGLREAIPVAIYQSFDFTLLPATSATGKVRVTITISASATVIPAGTVFSPSGYGIDFVSALDAVIAAGQAFADIRVSAMTPGARGNLPSGVHFTLNPGIGGMVSAVAQGKFSLGSDVETDVQRKERFIAYIASLPRGTVAAIRYGLSLCKVTDAAGAVIERVAFSDIVEPWLADPASPPGLIQCYIHNGVDGASTLLMTEVQKQIDGYYLDNGTPVPGWKAAGAKVQVIAATSQSVNVTGVVTGLPGYVIADLRTEVSTAIVAYISQLGVGADVIFAEIVSAAMAVPGVSNFVPSVPTADVAVPQTAKAVAGVMSIT